MAATCPSCSVTLTSSEATSGVCDSCGHKFSSRPTERSTSPVWPSPVRDPAPGEQSMWSAPVVPEHWPTLRWLVQLLAGLFLALFLGLALTIIPFVAPRFGERLSLALVFGFPFGLCLAAALNGLLVARKYRRLTFLSVIVTTVASLAYGVAIFGLGVLLNPPQ
jgi:hypothetical protein